MHRIARAAAAVTIMAALSACSVPNTEPARPAFDKDAYATELFERAEAYRAEHGSYPRSIDDVEDDKPKLVVNVWFMTDGPAENLCIEVVSIKGRASIYSDDPGTVLAEPCRLEHFM